MSRNPYLAASRPSSSFTRSSRTSKRNEPSKGSLLSRSRSSATIGGGYLNQSGSSSSYNTPSNYLSTPSSWQRSSSSTRLNRLSNDPPSSTTSSYRANDYTPASVRSADRSYSSQETSKPSLYRSTSTQNLDCDVDKLDISKLETSNVLFYRLIPELKGSSHQLILTLFN